MKTGFPHRPCGTGKSGRDNTMAWAAQRGEMHCAAHGGKHDRVLLDI
jgi:hypothetical protein